MRALALLLALLGATLPLASAAEPAAAAAPKDAKPLPDGSTKLPWHMINLWWTLPETADFESLEIDLKVSDDVDPAKLNLYIAPIGLGRLNETNFYGGIQTNVGGYPVSDASPQGAYHKGQGGHLLPLGQEGPRHLLCPARRQRAHRGGRLRGRLRLRPSAVRLEGGRLHLCDPEAVLREGQGRG
jgi:hypothetical protein